MSACNIEIDATLTITWDDPPTAIVHRILPARLSDIVRYHLVDPAILTPQCVAWQSWARIVGPTADIKHVMQYRSQVIPIEWLVGLDRMVVTQVSRDHAEIESKLFRRQGHRVEFVAGTLAGKPAIVANDPITGQTLSDDDQVMLIYPRS